MNVGELVIRIGADTGDLRRGTREARREVDSLPDEHIIRIIIDNKNANGEIKKTGNLAKGLGIAFVSLAPIIAAAIQTSVGALGGLASMLTTATVGTVGFGAVAIATLNDVMDAQKEIEKANKDMERASTKEEQQTAIENLAKAYVGLSAGQLAALASLQKFKGFWDGFSKSFQIPIVVGFSAALQGLQYLLEKLGPTINAAGYAIVTVMKNLNGVMQGSDFQKFISWLESSAGNAIATFGAVFSDVLQGVLNLMVAFQPVSDSMQGGLRGLAQSFLQWTQSLAGSQEFKDFLDFTIRVGPQFMTTIQLLVTILMDLVNAFAPLGSVMIGCFNSALALISMFTGLISGAYGAANGAEVAKSRFYAWTDAMWAAIKAIAAFLGFQVDATSAANNQSSAVYDVGQAYKDMLGSIGDLGGGLKAAGKDAEKFLAAFDEVYQIPDAKGGGAAPALPTLPAVPTLPAPTTTTSGGGSTGDTTSWVDKLLDKLKLIPAKIDMPDFNWPSPPKIVTDAIQAIKDKFNELKELLAGYDFSSPAVAFATMLNAMQVSLNAYMPYLTFGLGLLVLAMSGVVVQGPITSLSFATMLNTMQTNLNAYRPYLTYGLGLIALAMFGLQTDSPITSSAFSTMLNTMQVNLNAYEPYISFGLALISLSMFGIIPRAADVQKGFHAMLDFMQSKLNAYEPYISYGILGIVLSLIGLQTATTATNTNWNASWLDMFKNVHTHSSNMVKDIESVIAAQKRLNAALSVQPAAQSAPVESPAKSPTDGTYDPLPVSQPNPIAAIDYGKVLADAAAALWQKPMDDLSGNPFSVWMGKHPEYAVPTAGAGAVGGSAAGVAASRSKVIMEAFKKYLEEMGTGGAVTGFASGGIIGSDSIVRVGEKGRREAIVPLESGAMNPFADAVASRMGNSGGSSGGSNGRDVYIGVFDNSMLKSLERALKVVRIGEEQRGLNT